MRDVNFTDGRVGGQVPSVKPETWWDRLWRPFWTLPMAICAGAFGLGLLLPFIDRELAEYFPFVFQGGPDGARSVLSTIATAMISVTGLVFSITIVVLQLASSQFTPRVLASFLSSRITQITLGVFTATFIYSLTVMRSVRGGFQQDDPFVPQSSVTMAFVFVVASVGLFLAFIRHITASIQVVNVISQIGDRSVALVDKLYPDRADIGPSGSRTWSPSAGARRTDIHDDDRHGSVTHLDFAALVSQAVEHEVVIEAAVPLGSFVVEGQTVARAWGDTELPDSSRRKIAHAVGLGPDRLMNQELGFGIRQLVDIAERALSPSLNDPTTASQIIDELHRILRPLVQRMSPSPYLVDDEGTVRVVYRPQTVESLLHLAVEEIAHFGSDSPPVRKRLQELLDDLAEVADSRYTATLEQLRQDLQ
jgi:uncharacterized membrane protein